MDFPAIYCIVVALILVIHRLPGLIAPDRFLNFVRCFSANKTAIMISGAILAIIGFSGLIYSIFYYYDYGWVVIGISIVLLHKSYGFIFYPTKYGIQEYNAWNQTSGKIRLICGMSIIAGLILLTMAIYLF